FSLLRAYSALLPVQKIRYPYEHSVSEVHDFVLSNICLNTHFVKYPPSAQYQLAFWKWIMNQLESNLKDKDVSIDDRLYEKLFDAMSETRNPPPPPTFVTQFWLPGPGARPSPPRNVVLGNSMITVFESRTTIEAGTTGLRTWRASFVLSQFLISNPNLVRNASVLELGSGTGFVGIVAASIQMLYCDDSSSPSVVLTDVNEEVLQRCSENVRLPCNISSSHPHVEVCKLDWMDSLDEFGATPMSQRLHNTRPDVIVGADLLYHPDIVPALVQTLSGTLSLKHNTSVAYLALTIRNPDLFTLFL
ncbi:putative methyltransferase-domain-containing protein, partial [Vararia minispora EC-137]